jgi:hypothetical protein
MTTPIPDHAAERHPRSDTDAWARPVERLVTSATGSSMDRVTGRRVVGPIQGFGQMWQKTFTVELTDIRASPAEVVTDWKASFPSFWPKGAAFYAPLLGIQPGEVALLEMSVPGAPVRLSTGVMVIYADEESFAFMTPEGHMLSAWITFSAFREGDTTIVQIQALERTSDPIIELSYMFGANRLNDRFWEQTLAALARSVGVAEPVVITRKLLVDRRRQWRYARNIRLSPLFAMATGTITAPARWWRRRRSAGVG